MAGLRRFFLDDGNSRKRWQVLLAGKQATVRTGLISGALRETTTAYASPAEAKDKVAALIAAKQRAGYVEIDPSRLEIARPKGRRKATESQVAAFEQTLGCTLPEEYRQFLLTVNGGRPNPDCVSVPGRADIENVGVGTLFYLQPAQPGMDELGYERDQIGPQLPPGHLPIAGSSDVFTLSLKPKTAGCVYWWFHETDEVDDEGRYLESAGYLLAGSFDEFLTRIAGLFGDEDDIADDAVEPAETSKAGAGKGPRATIKRLLRLMNHDLTETKVREIEQVVRDLGDLSGIADGEWPFNNLDNPALLRQLLAAGLNPEITDTEGHPLLWLCAGSSECIAQLLERGVNVNRRGGGESETALMRAIYCKSPAAVEALLKAGANPTVRLSWPIEDALKANATIQQMLETARAEWKAGRNRPAPSLAASPAKATGKKGPQPTIPRLLQLLKHDFIPDDFPELAEIQEVIAGVGDLSGIVDGEWPTIDRLENPDLLRSLLEAGLNPEITAKDGGTLLSQCVMSPECMDLLLERGVAVDRRYGKDRGTALMRATYKGDTECIQRLLAAGADPTLEFTTFARVMLNLNEGKKALIEAAREAWGRGKE